jgi:hypothetical protein
MGGHFIVCWDFRHRSFVYIPHVQMIKYSLFLVICHPSNKARMAVRVSIGDMY